MKTRPDNAPPINSRNAWPASASPRAWFSYQPDMIPNSYFVAGATAADFADCLERAQRVMKLALAHRICHPSRRLSLSRAR